MSMPIDVTIDAWPEVLEVVDYKNGSGVFVPIEGKPAMWPRWCCFRLLAKPCATRRCNAGLTAKARCCCVAAMRA